MTGHPTGRCGATVRVNVCPTCRQAVNHPAAVGLYRLYWTNGGFSLAAVGMAANGEMWYAPVNWCDVGLAQTTWELVAGWESVDGGLIKHSKEGQL